MLRASHATSKMNREMYHKGRPGRPRVEIEVDEGIPSYNPILRRSYLRGQW